MTYLIIFCSSFLVRGTFDIFQNYAAASMGNVFTGVMLVVLYFFCEWLPICVIYIHHRQDFTHCQKSAQCRQLNLFASPTSPHKDFDLLTEIDDNHIDVVSATRSSDPCSGTRQSNPDLVNFTDPFSSQLTLNNKNVRQYTGDFAS